MKRKQNIRFWLINVYFLTVYDRYWVLGSIVVTIALGIIYQTNMMFAKNRLDWQWVVSI